MITLALLWFAFSPLAPYIAGLYVGWAEQDQYERDQAAWLQLVYLRREWERALDRKQKRAALYTP
jgi:hypothetical protein